MEYIMLPFTSIIHFAKTLDITIGGISFTFWDVWIYTAIVGVFFWFLSHVLHD